MKVWYAIALYWISLVRVIIRKETPEENKKRRNIFFVHLQVVLLCPLVVPFFLIVYVYEVCRNRYYKNLPKPLPKKLKKHLKKDYVLDEYDNTISLAEYNYRHKTEYTLDDVYGKGYIDSLTDKEKADITTISSLFAVLTIQENIPTTPYTEAAEAFADALIKGDFSVFDNLLDLNAKHITYKKFTIEGKAAIIEYWKGWRFRHVETFHVKEIKVAYSNYYSNACLIIDGMVVMFQLKENKIHTIILTTRQLNPKLCYHNYILDFPFDLDCIKHCLFDLKEPIDMPEPLVTENRIPCLSCGTLSEDLNWYSSIFHFEQIGFKAYVSVCPHCHKVVEYYPNEHSIHFTESVKPKKALYPKPHDHKKENYKPSLYGIRNFEGNKPLKGTEYTDGLTGNVRKAVEETDWFLLGKMNSFDLKKVKNCYQKAFGDGIYEAANILGVLACNYNQKDDEGQKYFRMAIDHGSHYAMLNMFTVLWMNEKYEDAINLLTEVYEKPFPSLKCLWNLAYFHFMGKDHAHNPLPKSKETAKEILRFIMEKEGDRSYSREKDVFKATKELITYIDEGNIFSAKAKDYHWRIRTNLNSLKKKGDDDVFYDLDALSLEEGFHMGLRSTKQDGPEDNSKFYVYNQDKQVFNNILEYIHVDETAMGAWQIYLLMTSYTLFPPLWGDGYPKRWYILQEADLYEIEALNIYNLSGLAQQDIYPSVDIDMNSNCLTAHIRCCYWNDWNGLIQEFVKVEIINGKVSSYENQGKFVMYDYDTGFVPYRR